MESGQWERRGFELERGEEGVKSEIENHAHLAGSVDFGRHFRLNIVIEALHEEQAQDRTAIKATSTTGVVKKDTAEACNRGVQVRVRGGRHHRAHIVEA